MSLTVIQRTRAREREREPCRKRIGIRIILYISLISFLLVFSLLGVFFYALLFFSLCQSTCGYWSGKNGCKNDWRVIYSFFFLDFLFSFYTQSLWLETPRQPTRLIYDTGFGWQSNIVFPLLVCIISLCTVLNNTFLSLSHPVSPLYIYLSVTRYIYSLLRLIIIIF